MTQVSWRSSILSRTHGAARSRTEDDLQMTAIIDTGKIIH